MDLASSTRQGTERGMSQVVVNTRDYSFECKTCRISDRFELPVSLDLYIAAMKAFMRLHRKCEGVGVSRERSG